MQISLPANSRTFVCGRTGSGKTTFAAFLLSQSNLSKPWIILDYKRDIDIVRPLIQTGRVDVQRKNFHRPRNGIAVIQPRPQVDDDAIEALLWSMWRKGRCGIFVDEALHLPPRSKAMTNILAQGRSKQIQVITCAQRPFFVSPFLISESENDFIFALNDKRDKDRIREFVPLPRDYPDPPPHCSYWWNSVKRNLIKLAPLANPEDIVPQIVDSLPARMW